MKIQLAKPIGALLTAGLFTLPNCLQAQPTAHYPTGLEGLKAATLPPPGIWFRDYNWFYYADHVNNASGDRVADQTAFIYAQAPRLIWITEVQVLGGYLGVDGLVPIFYKDLKGYDHDGGIGDLFFEGTWSRHWKQWDLAFGVGAWAPTGEFQKNNVLSAGNGYWTEMLTAGATWYPDAAKQWSVSVLNRYEFNEKQEDTDISPGQAYTVEGGIGYAITKPIEIGAIGYYQQQVTTDRGPGATSQRDRVAGIGPEVNAFFPDMMLGISLRYAYEFMAESRFQGNMVSLTITKKF
ncbi:MAG: transporter [Verrucomicrobia bacterium]|nr:transporter [Verrucomicrobiota bacterium]